MKGVTPTNHVYSPIPVKVNVDGVGIRFETTVITDAFPPGICLGPQGLRCSTIDNQDPTGEGKIDERASLVVSFTIIDAAPLPQRRLRDTASENSILAFSSYTGLTVHMGTLLRPYGVDLYAAKEKPSNLWIY